MDGKYKDFLTVNLGGRRDTQEEKAYQEKRNKQQAILDRIDRDIDKLKNDDRSYIDEFEAFIGVFRNASARFKKLTFVRKREFTQFFISNIKINRSKNIQITVFPYVEAIFKDKNSKTKKYHPGAISFGAPEPHEFEQMYKNLVNIPIMQTRQLFSLYIKYIAKNDEITKHLSKKQLVLYGLNE